jgi:hypothetical protein
MKKIILMLLFLLTGQALYCQATDGLAGTGNTFGGAKFLGWGGTSGLLPIKTNNFSRMTIQSNAAVLGLLDGRVTMANSVPVGFVPSARLHMFQFGGSGAANADLFRTDGISTVDNTWKMFTGLSQTGATEKFSLYIPANTNNAIAQTAINTGRMYFATNGANMRMRINGVQNPTVNGSVINTEGYIGMGNFNTNTPLNDVGTGPWTLLHLYGPNNFSAGFFGSGFRTWMKTGMSVYENSDHLYIGMKDEIALTGGTNFSDAVMAWGDDGGASPDDMRFIFTEAAPAAGFCTNCPTNSTGFNGREIMRMIYNGNVGIGPVFSKMPLLGTSQPQSMLHMNIDGNQSLWLQMTNQLGTGQSANDGIRLGMVGSTIANQNGTAYLYNQENRHLLFSTNAPTIGINLPAGATQERMRVTSIGAPTLPFGSFIYGTYNPAAIANLNTTRTSISYDPSAPIIRPMSLVHIGYGAAVNSAGTSTDGWRKWMDIGTYTCGSTDNMYVGLKAEGTKTYDAVINWGRNKDSLPNFGPDHLRFIFTGNYTGGAVNPDQSDELNGAELGRFFPGRDTTGLASGSVVTYGRFGVGDFTAAGLNQEPTHKLDVDGNGRFRLLPDTLYMADTTVQKIVMVDENGVLRWTSIVESELGYACGDTTNITMLTSDRFIPFHDHNIYFEGAGVQGPTFSTNAIGLGYGCGSLMPAKFNVFQQDSTPVTIPTIAGSFINNDHVSSTVGVTTITGIDVRSEQIQGSNAINVAGNFKAGGAPINIAIRATASATSTSTDSYGGFFQSIVASPNRNYGIYTEAKNASGNNYGIFAKAPFSGGTSGPNYAGYFDGDVVRTGNDNFTSDSTLKENIDTLSNALTIIKQLQPKTFTYKQASYPSMSLPGGLQYGLIAQEVEAILPDLVNDEVHPPKYDSAGTMVYAAVNYKALEYTQLVPIMIKAMQEQNKEVEALQNENSNLDSIVNALNTKNDAQDSIIENLNDRLTALENCINALHLCDSPSFMPTNNSTGGNNGNNSTDNATNVELNDAQSIVLDQNVPNPFAEQTTITFNLTEGVQKAQMLFYNAQGKLINSQDLQTKSGKGQLNVFANDLSNGIYTYTLVVDGKIIDTKRMVKNK